MIWPLTHGTGSTQFPTNQKRFIGHVELYGVLTAVENKTPRVQWHVVTDSEGGRGGNAGRGHGADAGKEPNPGGGASVYAASFGLWCLTIL